MSPYKILFIISRFDFTVIGYFPKMKLFLEGPRGFVCIRIHPGPNFALTKSSVGQINVHRLRTPLGPNCLENGGQCPAVTVMYCNFLEEYVQVTGHDSRSPHTFSTSSIKVYRSDVQAEVLYNKTLFTAAYIIRRLYIIICSKEKAKLNFQGSGWDAPSI